MAAAANCPACVYSGVPDYRDHLVGTAALGLRCTSRLGYDWLEGTRLAGKIGGVYKMEHHIRSWYGVATVSRIDKIIGLFHRILSLLQDSFAKETYNLIDFADRSHPISSLDHWVWSLGLSPDQQLWASQFLSHTWWSRLTSLKQKSGRGWFRVARRNCGAETPRCRAPL